MCCPKLPLAKYRPFGARAPRIAGYLNEANQHLAFSAAEWLRVRESVADSIRSGYGICGVDDAFRVQEGGRAFCSR